MPFKTKTVIRKSTYPIYAGALTFVLLSIIFPMYKMSSILLGLAVSLIVIVVLKKLNVFPDFKQVITYEEEEFFANKTIEEIVLEGREMKAQMASLNEKIAHEEVSRLIDRISKTHDLILEYVKAHPETHTSIRKYMKYYVPSILQLLNHFEELEETEIQTENAASSRDRIVELLKTADTAFQKQLDSLMDQQALDISVEAKVLEDLMSREGLLEK